MPEPIISLTSEDVSAAESYTRLREHGPLVRVTLPMVDEPTWLVTGFREVVQAMTDPRLVRDVRTLAGHEGPSITDQMIDVYGLPGEYKSYFGAMVTADGREHARLRSVLTRAFTPARVAALRPRARYIAASLFGAMAGRGHGEVISDFGNPLATAVLCELVGIPEEGRSAIADYIRFIGSGDDPKQFVPKLTALIDDLKRRVDRGRTHPEDDLVSALVRLAGEDGLPDTDVIAILFLLVTTGIMPPTQFIVDAVLAMLDHPDEVDRLRRRPEILRTTAVPELLRFTTSVPLGAPMYAVEDMDVCGTRVARGEALTPALLGANHDPQKFPGPPRLDLTREPHGGPGHVGLGHGAHYCIGSSLARLIGEVVVDQLFLSDHDLVLAVDREELVFRGTAGDGTHLTSLPVRIRPRAHVRAGQ
ncbi:cytochrome P450 [Pseudonocardia sp. ICBG1122]|nr:cytochrome P450 [Pseudonocardia sp. AL041005-10]ALE77170.1 hypothetical protein WY02_00195 [Pseudonocardia sp. AL041005-10]NWJ72085.1 cytochrome P450 [Pseudonocardia pini]